MVSKEMFLEAHIEYDNFYVINVKDARFIKQNVIGIENIIKEYKKWAEISPNREDYGHRTNFKIVFTERSLASIKVARELLK